MLDSFAEYVSLGNNCEVAFQIRRVLGRDSSSFFSWNVTPFSALQSLIRDRFVGILERGNITMHGDGELLNDASHDYKFHNPFKGGGIPDSQDFDVQFSEYRHKVDYLIGKFLRPRQPGERTAYFYKTDFDCTEDAMEVRRRSCAVRDLLSAIHAGSSFVLVVLQDVQWYEPQWAESNVYNRYLSRLAPWHDATDGHVKSWDKVFEEFPHVEPMCLAGF